MLTPGANTNNGSATWSYDVTDSKFDFLAAGETLTLTYTATVDDHHGGVVTKPITVTIHGANDTPTSITASSDGFTELAGTANSAVDHAGGAITFTDVDLSDRPVISAPFSGYSYKAADGSTSLTLTAQQQADLEVALTLTSGINTNNGSATWSYDVTDSKFDFLAAGETLTLTYIATVNDNHGGVVTKPITVTIHGTEDTPTSLTVSSDGFTELAGTGNTAIDHAGGVIAISFTDVDLSDRPVVTAPFSGYSYKAADGVTSLALTAQQQTDIEVALTLTPGANTNNGSATWAYDVADSKFDFLAAGETLTLTYTATLDDGHNGIVTKPITVTIHGTNDTPTSITASSDGFTELAGTGNAAVDHAGGTITFTDVDLSDRPAITSPFSGYSYLAADGTSHLALTTQQQTDLEAALTLTLGANTNNGSATWSYDVTDSKFDFLAAGETLTLTYTATVDDHHGGIVTKPITVTIHGTNDAPTSITASSDGFTELAGTGNAAADHAGGTITFTDVDVSDRPAITSPFSGYSYLAADGTSHLALTTQQQTDLEAALTLTLGANTNNGSATWSYDVTDSKFDFLAAGETLTLTYTATVDDHHGGIVTKPITVTIHGTNDAPAITSSAQTAAITEAADSHDLTAADTASGLITFADVDLTDTHDVTVAGVTASDTTNGLAGHSTQLGWLTLGALSDSAGTGAGSQAWNFSAPDHYFDYLAAGEKLTLTYTVQVADHHGGSTTQNVVVTVTGTNDAPAIAAASTSVSALQNSIAVNSEGASTSWGTNAPAVLLSGLGTDPIPS